MTAQTGEKTSNARLFVVCCLAVGLCLTIWIYRTDNFSNHISRVTAVIPGLARYTNTSVWTIPGLYTKNNIPANQVTKVDTEIDTRPKLVGLRPGTGNIASTPLNNSDIKRVLLWTPFFSYKGYGHPLGKEIFQNELCHYNNCVTTDDRRYESTAEVVLFHCRNPVKVWPKNRQPHQIHALYCVESPSHSRFRDFNHRINMTATYRLDSDLVTRYFKMVPRDDPVDKYVLQYPYESRAGMVMWVASNCQATSKRQEYVRELSKHISVETWGGCGVRKCPRTQTPECFKKFSSRYKFYLSFENSICQDYVTDKLFAPMMYAEIIPVTLGAGPYSKHVPNNTYIDIRNYKSPKDLAQYLKRVASDKSLFESYLQWKGTHKVIVENRQRLFCDLCKYANEGTYHKNPIDISSWWSSGTCDNSLVPKMRSNNWVMPDIISDKWRA